jgi:hypothetical protein
MVGAGIEKPRADQESAWCITMSRAENPFDSKKFLA